MLGRERAELSFLQQEESEIGRRISSYEERIADFNLTLKDNPEVDQTYGLQEIYFLETVVRSLKIKLESVKAKSLKLLEKEYASSSR